MSLDLKPRRRTGWIAVLDALATVWLVVGLCALLAGCDSGGSAPPGMAANVFTVITAVWKARKLGADRMIRRQTKGDDFKDDVTTYGEHVRFFLRERAKFHLLTQPNTDAVATTVGTEYDTIKAYVATTVGVDPSAPNAWLTSSDGLTAHLEYKDILRVYTADPPPSKDAIDHHQFRRWERATSVIWRAAALEPQLWDPAFSSAAMDDILDHRVRMAERMLYQMSGSMRQRVKPIRTSPHGPWNDGTRVRMFEYPYLDSSLKNKVGPENVGDLGSTKVWRTDFDGGQLVYNEGNGMRIRNAAKAAFVTASDPGEDPYYYDVLPTVPDPAKALDDLFTPSTDYWDRSWIFCDHVIAALHMESLRFAKKRRLGDDSMFNAAITSHPKGWAQLRPLLPGTSGDPRLLSDDAVKPPAEPRLFANSSMPAVQLGDHVVVWNSILYAILSDGAWSLENAVVVGVESDYTSNDVGNSVYVMGHGSEDATFGEGDDEELQYTGMTVEYFRRSLKRGLDTYLAAARRKVKNAPAGTDVVPFVRASSPLFRWAPFGETWVDEESGDPQDPWWVRIPYNPEPTWDRAIGRDATLHTLPDAVEFDPAAGHAPLPPGIGNVATSAFFPLWVPTQNGKWNGYIKRRKEGHASTKFELRRNKFDGKNVPGLVVPWEFVPGANTPQVYCVRPMVSR
jgi:hypothetical protein